MRSIFSIQNIEIGQHRGVSRPSQVPVKSAYLEQNTNYKSQFCKSSEVTNELAETETPIANDVPIIEKKKLADH